MAKYYQIMSGLRGCYMPGSSRVIQVTTRRELKSAIASALGYRADDCGYRYNRKSVAWAAARLWREGATSIIPFGAGKARPNAVEVCQISRAEYLEHCNAE